MKLTYAQKFIGGMLGLLGLSIGVNITMISLAVKTNDGLVTENYYEHGLHYDAEKPRTANPMEWKVRIDAPSIPQREAPFQVNLTTSANAPLQGAVVKLDLIRPNKAGFDRQALLAEIAPGRYEARMTIPLIGLWDATVHIKKGSERLDYAERLRIGTTP